MCALPLDSGAGGTQSVLGHALDDGATGSQLMFGNMSFDDAHPAYWGENEFFKFLFLFIF